ncbi:unnamed protein product [Spirodela intermedia]|uniref:Uncharacterized protein n=1 Tax=Spirodela intermedia TaxID=51605 RepID=A0ABN7EBV0_SPIIN|nr:unnamed protein product [Spirodela intermedia]
MIAELVRDVGRKRTPRPTAQARTPPRTNPAPPPPPSTPPPPLPQRHPGRHQEELADPNNSTGSR